MCEYRDRTKEELTRETAAVHTELKSEERVEDGLYRQQTQEQDEGFENPVIRRGEETQEGIIEAVPVCASAPMHLDAHVRTDFENCLNTLKSDLDNKITAIRALNADSLLSAQAVDVLEKFRVYADLRIKIIAGDQSVTLTSLDTAVNEYKQKLTIFSDNRNNLERQHQQLLLSATQHKTVPDKEKANLKAKSAALSVKLNDMAEMELLLQPCQDFLKSDQYKGGLVTHDPVRSHADSSFNLRPPENTMEVDKDGHQCNIAHEFKKVYDQPLFPRVPCVQDIRQGHLGDCYLLAGLASAVAADPSLIINAMQDMGDKVRVIFHPPGGDLIVEIEKSVPVKKSTRNSDSSIETEDLYAENCLWVQMMEKAYMASGLHPVHNPPDIYSYDTIKGGLPDEFLERLTGQSFKRESLAERSALSERNSLIGVFQRRDFDMPIIGSKAVFDRMLPITTPATLIHGIETTILRKTAGSIFLKLRLGTGISLESAVAIAVKLAEEEESRVEMLPDNDNNIVRTLKRAAYLDDLQKIIGISIPVPDTHTLDSNTLDELARTAGITIKKAGQPDELSDKLTDPTNYTQETIKLAVRIQGSYKAKAFFIPMNDAVTLAMSYVIHYKEKLAADLIKTLKKDQNVELAYSPFYTRTSGRTGKVKRRYTARGKQIYKFIEDAITAGKMVTAGTVDYQQSGDRAKKEGLVEKHAYSVLGTEEKDGARYVRVRNPWGHYERSYDFFNNAIIDKTNHQGVFLMELNDFMSNFVLVSEN